MGSRRRGRGRQRRIEASSNQNPCIAFDASVEIQAAAGDEPSKPRRFTVRAYNGGALRVGKYPLPVVVDLKGLEFDKDIVANLDHDPKQRVGHVDEPANDGRTVMLSGTVSATGSSAVEFVESSDNQFPWKASIEAQPTTRVESVPRGKRVNVNGQTFTGPILIARKSRLSGIAFLSRGADPDTHVTLAASAADSKEKKKMDPKIQEWVESDKGIEWIEAMGLSVDELQDNQKALLKAKYDIEQEQAKVLASRDDEDEGDLETPEFDPDDIRAAFADHAANLEAAYAEHEDEIEATKLADIRSKATKSSREKKAKAMKERWQLARCEAELIRAQAEVELELVRAERPTGPAIHAPNRDVNNDVIEAALCMSLGMPDIEERFKEEVLEAAHQNFKWLGLQEAIIMAAQANGYSGRAKISDGNLRDVMRYAFPIHAAGAVSNLSLSGVLSNIANKELLMGFEEEDSNWREIAAVKPVTDFKAITSYRLLDNMEYEELGPSGEIAHGSLGEESYTRQAKTYAKMFALTRTDIINDDLGAFDALRTRLGKGAAIKFNNIFWKTFLDALATFFTAARGNYIDGADSVLDSAGLTKGVLAFRTRTTPEKRRAGGRPDRLIVPPELEADADELYTSRNINTGGSSTKTKVPNRNTHENKYRPVVCNFASDSTVSSAATGTGWGLLQDPRVAAAVCVSFLNGQQSPTIESADADFNMLGVQFRGYHDFGVDMAEYTAGVWSKGAA